MLGLEFRRRKRREEDVETTGFQRDENPKRIASIVSFMTDCHNVIQNPLLCAVQSDICGKVTGSTGPIPARGRSTPPPR